MWGKNIKIKINLKKEKLENMFKCWRSECLLGILDLDILIIRNNSLLKVFYKI